jgi:hypothetical protein
MTRGETKARGASRRMCRSPWASRCAMSVKEALRPSRMSSIHSRALAMGLCDRRQYRRSTERPASSERGASREARLQDSESFLSDSVTTDRARGRA